MALHHTVQAKSVAAYVLANRVKSSQLNENSGMRTW